MTSHRTLTLALACALLLGLLATSADATPATFQSPPPTPSPSPLPTPVLGTITGTVHRQGVPANPNPGGGTEACSAVTAIGASTYGPVNTSGLGVFGIANVPAETYTVRATYPGYLTSEKTGIVVDGVASTFDAGTTRLLGGDATGDNVINILDVSLIISKFGQTGLPVLSASSTCTGTDEMSDINDDGIVNISDLAITAGNWNKVGPLPWLP
jgi:hypothetical protein